jgi:hypothetical protein
MEAGDIFIRVDNDKHLWIVLSDPKLDPEKVLIVNLTTLDARKEQVCVLKRGDHSWVKHDTCVNYQDSVVTTVVQLNTARDQGAIDMKKRMSTATLKKIRDGALESERMPMLNADVLFEQGLVDC